MPDWRVRAVCWAVSKPGSWRRDRVRCARQPKGCIAHGWRRHHSPAAGIAAVLLLPPKGPSLARAAALLCAAMACCAWALSALRAGPPRAPSIVSVTGNGLEAQLSFFCLVISRLSLCSTVVPKPPLAQPLPADCKYGGMALSWRSCLSLLLARPTIQC